MRVPMTSAKRAWVSIFDRLSCLPMAPRLPISQSENFSTFSFYGQLSDKLSDFPMCATYMK